MRLSQALASQRERVLALAAASGATSVRVFGSVAKGVDQEGSDIDLLVAMPAGTSLLHIVGLQLDIADALGGQGGSVHGARIASHAERSHPGRSTPAMKLRDGLFLAHILAGVA